MTKLNDIFSVPRGVVALALAGALFLPHGAFAQAEGTAKGDQVSQPERPKAAETAPIETPQTKPVAVEQSRAVEDTGYAVKLRTLEERVNDLKERIFRSKARLILLRETVLNGVISGAKAVIIHRNEMGASFTLERVSYSLDGEPLFNKADEEGSLDAESEIKLFDGSIVPGNHNLSVYMLFRGNGYGVFSYLRDYKFTVKTSYPFTAEEGKQTTVRAVAYERGGITTRMENRLDVRFENEVKQDVNLPNQPVAAEGQAQ